MPCAPHVHLSTFVFGTDQGPDQVYCDKLIRAEITHKPLTLCFRKWCNEHAAHLMVKRQLSRLGTSHWGDMAKARPCIAACASTQLLFFVACCLACRCGFNFGRLGTASHQRLADLHKRHRAPESYRELFGSDRVVCIKTLPQRPMWPLDD